MDTKLLPLLHLATPIFFGTYFANFAQIGANFTNIEWEKNMHNSAKNVHIYAEFVADIYKAYCRESGFLRDQRRKLTFYNTLVNFAVDLSRRYAPQKSAMHGKFPAMPMDDDGFFWATNENSDLALVNILTKAFNDSILKKEKSLGRPLVNQILLLTFSLAARRLLCVSDDSGANLYEIDGPSETNSKLGTLLNAFKRLSKNRESQKHCIFPFRILNYHNNGYNAQLSVEFIAQDAHPPAAEQHQMQYISNFEFVLQLSNFTLTPYEVFKVVKAIASDFCVTKDGDDLPNAAFAQPPPTVYTFLKEFIGKNTSPTFETKAFFLEFGISLFQPVHELFFARTNGVRLESSPLLDLINDGTFYNYYKILDEVFHERLSNYELAIGIDYHQCKEIVQIAEDLKATIVLQDSKNKMKEQFLWKAFLFQILMQMEDNENLMMADYLPSEPLALLDQIIGQYKCNRSECPMHRYAFAVNDPAKNVPKFSQIFSDALSESSADGVTRAPQSGKVLTTFATAFGEHILDRLFQLIKERTNSVCEIGTNLDFVKSLQNIASTGQIERIVRRKAIPTQVNSQLFKLLFCLAIRLSAIIGPKQFSGGNHLKTFVSAYKCIAVQENIRENSLFLNPIYILPKTNELIIEQINSAELIPTVNEIEENFKFLLRLSNYSPTVYEILQMAKTLGDENDSQILISPSDPPIFVETLQYLTKSMPPIGGGEPRFGAIQTEFCALANFVGDLLEQIYDENYLPANECIELITDKFILAWNEKCTENNGKESESFEENLLKRIREMKSQAHIRSVMHFGKAIQVNFDPHIDLTHTVQIVLNEIGELLKKREWNCVHLNYTKMLEWNLIKIGLYKIGNEQKWEEIDHLKLEWSRMFDGCYFNGLETGREMPNFEEAMTKLMRALAGISIRKFKN